MVVQRNLSCPSSVALLEGTVVFVWHESVVVRVVSRGPFAEVEGMGPDSLIPL